MRQRLIAPDSKEAHQRIVARIRAFTAEDFARMDARESAASAGHSSHTLLPEDAATASMGNHGNGNGNR